MEGVDYLADERKKAEFNVEEMKIVWAGSRHAFEVSDRMSKLVANDPVIIFIVIPNFPNFNFQSLSVLIF